MAIEVIPDELAAAVRPLHAAGTALRSLGDARRRLEELLDGVPSAELRDAFAEYVASWSHLALDVGDQAVELGDALAYAARYYAEQERALARGLRYDRRLP
jgi:hypothetical protein